MIINKKKGSKDYVYYGFQSELNILEPEPSIKVYNESAIFATNNYIDAVISSIDWTEYNITYTGDIIIERYFGALDKLNKKGYIHYLDAQNFQADKRLQDGELVSFKPARPEKCVVVNVKEEIEKSDIAIITYDEMLKKITIKKNNIKFKNLYVPIDLNWDPKIVGAVRYRNYSAFNKDIKRGSVPPENVIMDNLNIIKFKLVEYDCEKKYLVIPKYVKYTGSPKSSEDEYIKYLDTIKKIYSDYEKLII
jgi:hypothetical protein